MAAPISLIEMPKIPMEHILEYLDFQSILILRKTCHDLRNLIDDTKPASHLTEISVYVYPELINFYIFLPRPPFCIDYIKNGEICLLKCYKDGNLKKTRMVNEDFATVFCKDFDIILRHQQKTLLEKFHIRFDFLEDSKDSTVCNNKIVLENVNKFLKSMKHPLQVKSLYMGVNNHDEIMPILPYIDSKPLKLIYIDKTSKKLNDFLDLNKIGQLEQWKKSEELEIYGFGFPHPAQNLKYFSKITLYLREVSTDVIVSSKEMFLCSSTLSSMIICNYGNLLQDAISQKLIELFGQPFVDSDQDINWFFRIPDTNQLLRIKLRYNQVDFICIEQSDLPPNAVTLS